VALTPETARAILAQAKADETYEAPIPEDDDQAVGEATELVDQARSAWEENIRGPEVEAILNLADNDEGEEGGSEAESESEDGEGEEDLSAVEPWEDYDKEKVADIKIALEWSKENDSGDDFLALARHVWEYESGGKARSTVLSFLDKLGEGDEEAEGSEEGETPDDAGEAEAGSGDEAGAEDGEGDGEEDSSSGGAAESDADDDASGEAGESGEEDGADEKPATKARKKPAAKSVATEVDSPYTVGVDFGGEEIVIAVFGKNGLVGTIQDALESGATQILVTVNE
jgi:hypothetical protein